MSASPGALSPHKSHVPDEQPRRKARRWQLVLVKSNRAYFGWQPFVLRLVHHDSFSVDHLG
jgi:hypothetical protein